MLAVPSLKDALAHYKSPIRRHLEIIERWKLTAGIEPSWQKIQQTARAKGFPELDPEEFIHQVLSSTWSVKPIIDQDKAVKAAFADCRDEIVKTIEGCSSPLELLRVLGWERDSCVYLQDIQDRLRELDKSGCDFNRPSVFGRKDQKGSRDRAAFNGRMRRYLIECCGQPCDEIVAQLVSIAFDLDDVSTDQVRRRPTTSKQRRKKR